ncbi:centrosomal protein of 135 kDa-like [Suncus etruscus]|uniref:centrosomal protein of 135 kDa-like n=1 Tax=Suncus etruscus TaxID=109475 RepID=UPI0021107ABC|nr:centrosomal protein of 135 kDa-like [Suncus etruscus]
MPENGPSSIAFPGNRGVLFRTPRWAKPLPQSHGPTPLPGSFQPHPPATSGRAGRGQRDRKRQERGGGSAGSRGLGVGAGQLGRNFREGRDTTKEYEFGLGAPVSEAEKYQNTLQLEQEERNQDKFILTLKLQIEDLKQTNHDLEEYVRKLLDSKEVVRSHIDDLTNHNEHLCKELIKVDQLARQLENEKNFVVDTADKELEEAKIQLICQQNNIIVLEDTIKRLRSIILETEKTKTIIRTKLSS